jgi:hypothetical protein
MWFLQGRLELFLGRRMCFLQERLELFLFCRRLLLEKLNRL